jgi:hypothetical protein
MHHEDKNCYWPPQICNPSTDTFLECRAVNQSLPDVAAYCENQEIMNKIVLSRVHNLIGCNSETSKMKSSRHLKGARYIKSHQMACVLSSINIQGYLATEKWSQGPPQGQTAKG